MFELLTPSGVVAAALIAPPGADVIDALTHIDPTLLHDYLQTEYLLAWERQTAWVTAQTQPALATIGRTVETAATRAKTGIDSVDMPLRAAFAEISAALRISEVTAGTRLQTARALAGPLAAVAAMLADGDLTFAHVNAIWEATSHLSDAKAGWVAARVLPRARKQSVAQLRRSLLRAVHAVQPRTIAQKARQAHADRSLDFWTLPDGTAELRLIGSAADILAVYGTADLLAKRRRRRQPPRGTPGWQPLAALRSDALVDLATGAATAPGTDSATGGRFKPAVVTHVTLDLATLFGLRDNPAELAGYGPLPANLARILAADSKWRRLLHDPLTGALLDLGHTTHDPSADLTRYIDARDRICAFPFCNQPARVCDIDHTVPYTEDDTGGGTDRNNLGDLCGHHHRIKHETSWHLTRDPVTEQPTWTSPTGHTYTVEHHDHRSYQTADPTDQLTDEPPDWIEPTDPPDDSPSDAELGICTLPDFDELPDPIPPAVGTWPFDDLDWAA